MNPASISGNEAFLCVNPAFISEDGAQNMRTCITWADTEGAMDLTKDWWQCIPTSIAAKWLVSGADDDDNICIFVYFINMADRTQPFTREVNKIQTRNITC